MPAKKVVEWASENKKHRGCIVLATDEKIINKCSKLDRNRVSL